MNRNHCSIIVDMAYNEKSKENLKSFEPGESGNPSGRKKGSLNLKTILNKFLEIDSGEKHPETGESMNVYEQSVLAQIKKMKKGDLNSFKEIVDRKEGRAIQTSLIAGGGDEFEGLTIEEKKKKLDELLKKANE